MVHLCRARDQIEFSYIKIRTPICFFSSKLPYFPEGATGWRTGQSGTQGRGKGKEVAIYLSSCPKWDMNPDTHCHMLSAPPSPKIPVVVALTNVGSCHLVASSSRERYRRALPVGVMSESQNKVMYEKSHSRTGGWERCCMMLNGVGQKQGQNSPRFSHTRRGYDSLQN